MISAIHPTSLTPIAAPPPERSSAEAPSEAPTQVKPATPLPAGAQISDGTMAALMAEQGLPGDPINFRGQDLRAVDLKNLDLRGADLSGANLSGLDLSGLDLRGANLDGADLSGAILKGAKLDGASAKGANLADATFVNTTFDGADFSNAKFDRAFIGKEDEQDVAAWDMDRRLVASGVKLDGASFKEARLQGVFFKNASAVGADFSHLHSDVVTFRASNLEGANFEGASGRKLSFFESDLSGAALTKTAVNNIDITSTILDQTKFAGSSLNGISFGGANLSVADLTGVLREAKAASFNNVNLDGIDFSGFDFSGAHFNGDPTTWTMPDHRDVQGAGPSMNGTKFDGAKFEAARFQGLDTSAASFAGATFNAIAQGKSAISLAGVAGVGDWSLETYSRYLALRGISLPMPGGAAASAEPIRSLVDDPVKPDRQRPGHITPVEGSEEAVDQTASLALETLKSINAQMRAATTETEPEGKIWERQRQDDRTLAII